MISSFSSTQHFNVYAAYCQCLIATFAAHISAQLKPTLQYLGLMQASILFVQVLEEGSGWKGRSEQVSKLRVS